MRRTPMMLIALASLTVLSVPSLFAEADGMTPLSGTELQSFLPAQLAGYELTGDKIFAADSSKVTQVQKTFDGQDGSSVNIFLGDMSSNHDLLMDFLSAQKVLSRSVAGSLKSTFDGGIVHSATVESPLDSVSNPLVAASVESPLDSVSDPLDSVSNPLVAASVESPLDSVSNPLDSVSNPLVAASVESPFASVSIDTPLVAATVESPASREVFGGDSRWPATISLYESLTHDVAGWRIYDNKAKAGALILVVKDRFAVLVEGSEIESLQQLEDLASKIDLDGLEKLSS